MRSATLGLAVFSTIALLCRPAHVTHAQQSPIAPVQGVSPVQAIDVSTVKLKGDGMGNDSVALALQAAARVLGVEADYADLGCRLTNTFAPGIDLGEDCTSWWHVDAGLGDLAMQSAASGIGLRAVPLSLPAAPAKDEAGRREILCRLATAIQQAMQDSSVVITTGGWDVGIGEPPGPHGFVPWGWAGVITDATPEDGTIRGAHLNGYTDNRVVRPAPMWVIARDDAAAADGPDLETLRLAVDRIRGQGRFRPTPRRVYGLDAMDAWIKQMEQVAGFCRGCHESSHRGWTDAVDNHRRMVLSAQTAAGYLQSRAARLEEPARSCLTEAAAHYERIAQLLGPSLSEDSGQHLKGFIGDLPRQATHAREVLVPVRDGLASAADEMDRALAASLPESANVRDVPFGQGNGHGFARGLQVLLRFAGIEADYDVLMGDLGLAFVIQANDQAPLIDGAVDVGWWPLDPACVPTYLQFVGQVVGRQIEYFDATDHWGKPPGCPERTVILTRVKAALAAGRPALGDRNFWKVLTGYDAAEQPFSGFCPRATESPIGRLEGQVWAGAVLGQETPRIDRATADLAALGHAVALGRDEIAMPRGYVTGQKAFALWAAALRDTEHLGQARWHSNVVLNLRINRQSAVAYLTEMARRHPAEAGGHIRSAAALYSEALDRLTAADTSPQAMGAQPGRERLAQLAEHIAALEAQAVDELDKAARAANPM